MFGGDLFVVSGDTLYRMNNNLGVTPIQTGLFNPERGVVKMSFVQQIGAVPERMFFADGRNLWAYEGGGVSAGGILTASGGGPANNDVVVIGSTYYKFTNSDVDAGTPAGTSANPWLVALGADTEEAMSNLGRAINGESGSSESPTASSNISPNPDVQTSVITATTVSVVALFPGEAGNSIETTETGTNLAWGSGTLTGGSGNKVIPISTPNDIGIFDVATIASYVICIPVQVGEFIGRFYWIEPGEVTIDPLNFATAESSPDGILGVEVSGDKFWLPGEKRTEVWIPSGNPAAPMQRVSGVVYDRGAWEGTIAAIKENLIIVDGDGGVFLISGGAPKRISTPDIEEQIRGAIERQKAFEPY